jgi:hypothetical protein
MKGISRACRIPADAFIASISSSNEDSGMVPPFPFALQVQHRAHDPHRSGG